MYFSAASYISSSEDNVDMSMMFSQSVSPALNATALTVSGLSPDIIFTSTPSCLKNFSVSGASLRILSVKNMNPSNLIEFGNFSLVTFCSVDAKARTRNPC